MIQILDKLKQLRNNLNSQLESNAELMTRLVEFYQDSGIFDHDPDEWQLHNGVYYLDLHFASVEETNAFRDRVTTAATKLKGSDPIITLVDEQGNVKNFQIDNSWDYGGQLMVILKSATPSSNLIWVDDIQIYDLIVNIDAQAWPTFNVTQENKADVFSDTYLDLVGRVSESYTCTDIASKALALVEKGQFSMAAFKTSLLEIWSSLTGKAQTFAQTIIASMQGESMYEQAQALLTILQKLWGGWNGASSSSNIKINFNSNDYTVNTSIGWPIVSTVVQTASTILSLVGLGVMRVLGAAVAIVSNIVGKVVEEITENNSTHARYIGPSERGHDGFAMPFIQFTSTMSKYPLPDWVAQQVQTDGICKLINGLYTIYVWTSALDSQAQYGFNTYYIEGYLNMNPHFDMYDAGDQSDALRNMMLSNCSFSIDGSTDVLTYNMRDPQVFISNFQNYCESTTMDTTNYNVPFEDETIIQRGDVNRRTLGCLTAHCATLSLLLLSILGQSTGSSGTASLNGLHDDLLTSEPFAYNYDNTGALDVTSMDHCEKILCEMLKWSLIKTGSFSQVTHIYTNLDIAKLANWNRWNSSNPYDGANENSASLSTIYAGIVNKVIPAIRAAFNSKPLFPYSTQTVWKAYPVCIQLLYCSDFVDDTYTQTYPNAYAGVNWRFTAGFAGANKDNGAVLPPDSTISVWVRLGVAAAVIAAVTVTSILATVKVKRYVNYRAEVARAKISSARETFAKTQSMSDYNMLYKETRKYNRLWGKLTGTSYDLSQDWVNSVDRLGAADGGTATATLLNTLASSNNALGQATLAATRSLTAGDNAADAAQKAFSAYQAATSAGESASGANSNTSTIINNQTTISGLIGDLENLVNTIKVLISGT